MKPNKKSASNRAETLHTNTPRTGTRKGTAGTNQGSAQRSATSQKRQKPSKENAREKTRTERPKQKTLRKRRTRNPRKQRRKQTGREIGENKIQPLYTGETRKFNLSYLTSTSTPAEIFNFIRASIVCSCGDIISKTRLWTVSSNCSRDFLLTCGDRKTV
jgi:hypothetical protein